INKDIPSNCTYITKKSGVVLYK
ncbi:hypothetical protein ACUV91_005045, partial [Escherichia coli]